MASSSECSSALDESVVSAASASAASEQYDDEFDDYSDSFESDDGAEDSEAASTAAGSTAADAGARSNETGPGLLNVGTRAQVFWEEENEWFNRLIQRVEGGNEPRYFVHYDDGEQAWEPAVHVHVHVHPQGAVVLRGGDLQGPAKIRPLPATLTTDAEQFDQAQQLLPLSELSARSMVGRRAIVYCPDEAEWFGGVVGDVQASPAAVKIEYDDGDSRWEQAREPSMIVPSPSERVLYARPYRQVVSDHFKPVRIARPYRCVVEKHSESVIIARRPYSERRYLHTVHEALQCSRCYTTPSSQKADSIAQTTLSTFFPESHPTTDT
ncbi:unnamed protein product [Phytophthora fragariaefolia]|uniref:Unnamed protein product n=1 Tax=Phytophthora fragariaefolia TaxID=1490495 RepID=A0A9W6X161_9STRA|nr:unnamed protein product [Phytophthora fragariaefolia]